MGNEIKSQKSISIGEILKQSFLLYKNNFCLFIGIVILGNALMLLHGTLLSFMPDKVVAIVSLIITLVSICILLWANMALIIAASNRHLNNRTTLKECFFKTKGIYWRFIGVNLMYFLISVAGLLLFVIPGIYLGTIFLLAPIVVALEKKGIRPFETSKALVKGSFWKVFLLNLITFVLLLFGLYFGRFNETIKILADIFVTFCASFLTVATVILYHKLKEKREAEQSLQKIEVPIKRGPIGCFSAIGLIILIIILATCWTLGLRGTRASEYIKNTLSPEIALSGGVTLERPYGRFVIRGRPPEPEKRYKLIRFGFGDSISSIITLWSIPIKDLNVAKDALSLDNQVLGDNILNHIKKSLLAEALYKAHKPQPIKTIALGGRKWGEFNYVLECHGEKAKKDVWKNYYTIYDDYILVVSYQKRQWKPVDVGKIQEDLLKEDKEIQNIISTIKFP